MQEEEISRVPKSYCHKTYRIRNITVAIMVKYNLPQTYNIKIYIYKSKVTGTAEQPERPERLVTMMCIAVVNWPDGGPNWPSPTTRGPSPRMAKRLQPLPQLAPPSIDPLHPDQGRGQLANLPLPLTSTSQPDRPLLGWPARPHPCTIIGIILKKKQINCQILVNILYA